MGITKLVSILLVSMLISSCKGSFSQKVSSNRCAKIYESMQREDCYRKVSEFNNNLQERIDKAKREERKKQKLSFEPKEEEKLEENK